MPGDSGDIHIEQVLTNTRPDRHREAVGATIAIAFFCRIIALPSAQQTRCCMPALCLWALIGGLRGREALYSECEISPLAAFATPRMEILTMQAENVTPGGV